ncbi:MAG: hypothetical protein GX086_07685, partial [Alcaligenaceae bacterium]|nr:hypothetical protein [Alcaligenaceae bacterium]
MKQQQLTDLALRKIYHAEQMGMDAKIVDELRAAVHKANAALDHDTQYITQECSML